MTKDKLKIMTIFVKTVEHNLNPAKGATFHTL